SLPDDAVELLANALQELFDRDLVGARLRELRRRHEHGGARVELFSDLEQRLQRCLDDLALAEPLLADLAWREHGKVEAIRSLASPAANRPHPRKRVMRLLDLDEHELLEVPRRRDRKAGTPNSDRGLGRGHWLRTIARQRVRITTSLR